MSAAAVARAVVAAGGAALIATTAGAAVRTVVLPRGVPVRSTRVVFRVTRFAFLLLLGPAPSYARRDRIMAMFAPVGLLALLVSWLAAVWLGYTALLWGLGSNGFLHTVEVSGSALTTLGYLLPGGVGGTLAAETEAVVGLALLALLITYLPSLYAAFSRREQLVTKLEVRAGSPPSGTAMLVRFWQLRNLAALEDEWAAWESWFADVEESHTTFPMLGYFRSPQPDHSWVTAAGAVLDCAALRVAAIDAPRDVEAQVLIRAGYIALRRIAWFFGVAVPDDPRPDDPISVRREEFEEALDTMAAAGVPLREDRDEAWRAFAGWRVNYDAAVVLLAALTMAPYAPWGSDRSLVGARPHRRTAWTR